jgi:hypothetical protein
MGGLTVRVVDPAGSPVPGAAVSVAQRSHQFLYGTAIANGPLLGTNADSQRYRDTLKRLFNYTELENQLKWNWADGNDFNTADRMLAWCAMSATTSRARAAAWWFGT